MSHLNLENLLDISDIIETEKKLRSDMASHIRSLFKEPRSSEFLINLTTKEDILNISSNIEKFSSNEGKLAAEHFYQMIHHFFGSQNSSNQLKLITEDEYFLDNELIEKESIWIRFINDVDFIVYTHTIVGFSSEYMSLKDIAVFYDIISSLYLTK